MAPSSIFIRPFHYLFRYKRNIAELRYELRDIEITRNEVRLSIYKATKDTKKSNDASNGENLLLSVNEIVDKARGVLEEYTIESKEGCLYGWCPNLIYRYRLSRKAEGMAESIVGLQGTADIYLTQDSDAPSSAPNSAALSTEMFASKAIVNALSVEHIYLVGLYGSGGTGKTSVVTNVWKTAINQGLYDEIAMVNVTGNLSVTLIQDEVASVLGLRWEDNISSFTKQDLLSHLLNSTRRKTLIVLDDVRQAFDMREVGIPVGDKCQVIVVSRSEEVCIQMGSKKNFCMHEFLPGGWEIFKRGAGKWVEKAGLHSIAKELVEYCGESTNDFGALATEVESRIDKIERLIASSLYVALNEHRLDI